MILTTAIISLQSINWMVPVMDAECILSVTEGEFIYVIKYFFLLLHRGF